MRKTFEKKPTATGTFGVRLDDCPPACHSHSNTVGSVRKTFLWIMKSTSEDRRHSPFSLLLFHCRWQLRILAQPMKAEAPALTCVSSIIIGVRPVPAHTSWSFPLTRRPATVSFPEFLAKSEWNSFRFCTHSDFSHSEVEEALTAFKNMLAVRTQLFWGNWQSFKIWYVIFAVYCPFLPFSCYLLFDALAKFISAKQMSEC